LKLKLKLNWYFPQFTAGEANELKSVFQFQLQFQLQFQIRIGNSNWELWVAPAKMAGRSAQKRDNPTQKVSHASQVCATSRHFLPPEQTSKVGRKRLKRLKSP
jgi:hypothetical protein